MSLQPLVIGDLVAKVPIIQGGMGVGISMSGLAGAVAKEGGIGIISAAQPGFLKPGFEQEQIGNNLQALGEHIHKAKEISNGGIVGVNIMHALKYFDEYVNCCVENGADVIISGAGLPATLPTLLEGTNVKFAPVVSSLKAVMALFKRWDKRNGRVSDFVVIEGPDAGGHLGFSLEELSGDIREHYDDVVVSIVNYVKEFEEKYQKKIPVIFAGGVYDRKDIDHYLSLGCAGVQMATRFVATEECDADIRFKEAYIHAKKEDIAIVKSPVGMPGRAIRNDFIKEREQNPEKITKCYGCLNKCNPAEIPYCITSALVRAAKGDVDNALVFCGSNAWRVDKITTVHEIFEELTQDRDATAENDSARISA